MTNLRDLQRNFINDCLSGELSDKNISIAPDIDTDTISAKGRMGIYRESAIGNITIPMQLTYPVVEKLVGSDFFRATCRQYIQTHWPETGNMDDYGDDFSLFLEAFKPAQHIPYLSDVARLEWLLHESSIADDQTPSNWIKFAELTEEELENVHIGLHPSVRLFSSLYPVKEIWDMNQDGTDALQALNLDEDTGGELVVVRQEYKTHVYAVDTAEYGFLKALLKGNTLFDAVDAAVEVYEACNLQLMMERYLGNAVLCTFENMKRGVTGL